MSSKKIKNGRNKIIISLEEDERTDKKSSSKNYIFFFENYKEGRWIFPTRKICVS